MQDISSSGKSSSTSSPKILSTLEQALLYIRSGWSLIPIARDGSKTPETCLLPIVWDNEQCKGKSSWKPFQEAPPTEEDVIRWFGRSNPPGIALVHGGVSGGSLLLDFDREHEIVYPRWVAMVDAEAPGLLGRVSRIKSPDGIHSIFRCPDMVIPGNAVLASISPAEEAAEKALAKAEGRKAHFRLIETRAEGGYALAPGCPPECHPTGRLYEHIAGPTLDRLGYIGVEEVEILMRCARFFDRSCQGAIPPTRPRSDQSTNDLTPGDDFDRRVNWADVLTPHGWSFVFSSGGLDYWRRPSKDSGSWSATTGARPNGNDLLHIFSSNASPLEEGKNYGKFNAYTLLNHGGQHADAARELRGKGFGGTSSKKAKSRATQNPATPPLTPPSPSPLPASGNVPIVEPDDSGELVTTCLSTVHIRPIDWLVPNLIPLGKLTMIAGDGGHGKSSLTLDMAACLSRGLPCFGLDYPSIQGSTYLLSCEDDIADTIVPRLLAAGADLTCCHAVEGVRGKDGKIIPFNLTNYDALERSLERNPQIRLVVIDPAGAFIGRTGIDDNSDSELRALLAPLAELAARRYVAIIIVKHLNKGVNIKAVARVGGSVAYINTVRSALLVAPDPDDDTRCFIVPMKTNLSPKGHKAIAYRLSDLSLVDQQIILAEHGSHLDVANQERLARQLYRLEWLGAVDITADAALANGNSKKDQAKTMAQCEEWVIAYLGAYAHPSGEVLIAGERFGYSMSMLHKARKKLKDKGIIRVKPGGFQADWFWGPGQGEWVVRPDPKKFSADSSAETVCSDETIVDPFRDVS